MSLLGEADDLTEAVYEQKDLPGPSAAPHHADEAVAILNRFNNTWSIWAPDKPGWAVLPIEAGAQALAEAIGAHRARRFCIWRAVRQKGISGQLQMGITKLAAGVKGQPISGALAIVLNRWGALDLGAAVTGGVVATPATYAALQAPIRIRLTQREAASVPSTMAGENLPDATPISESDAPPPAGEPLAGVAPGVMPPGNGTGVLPIVGGLGIIGWAGMAYGAYWLWKKYKKSDRD